MQLQEIGLSLTLGSHVLNKLFRHCCAPSFEHEPLNTCFFDGHHGLLSAALKIGSSPNLSTKGRKELNQTLSSSMSKIVFTVE